MGILTLAIVSGRGCAVPVPRHLEEALDKAGGYIYGNWADAAAAAHDLRHNSNLCTFSLPGMNPRYIKRVESAK